MEWTNFLADGSRNTERLWIAGRAFSATMLVFTLYFLVICSNGFDPLGNPLGSDFMSFYSASKLTLGGNPAGAYDMDIHAAAQNAIFGRAFGYSAFFYPPVYLLVCLPLALVPYFWALALFEGATLLLYWQTVRRFGGKHTDTMLVLAIPAVFVNLGHGQNGFLSTALFGAALLSLDTRPVIAGILFGCLAYKPHLGIVIPFVLIAARRWHTFASAAATIAVLAALATGLFGVDIWQAFLRNTPMAAAALEQGFVSTHKMQSTYAAVRLLGGSPAACWASQGCVSVCAIAAAAWVAAKSPRAGVLPPLVSMAALLASPFLLDYDLVLLALPLAWLMAEGNRTGFRPGEKAFGLMAFVLPLFARIAGGTYGVPLGPFVVGALFVVLFRRAFSEAGCHDQVLGSLGASHAASGYS